MSLTLRIRPVHLALCVLLLLSSLPPALGVGAAYAVSFGPATAAATPAPTPSVTTSPLSPTATTTATASMTSTMSVTVTPTASAPTLAVPTKGLSATATARATTTATTGGPATTPVATPSVTSPTALLGAPVTVPARASATATDRTLSPHGAGRSAPTPSPTAGGGVHPFSNINICPPSWSCADIGNPPAAGTQTLSNDTWTVTGGGQDIGGTADQFHFVWQGLPGNGSVSARVVSQTITGPWTKAGVMVRADTTASAPFYAVVLIGTTFQVDIRATAGGGMVNPAGTTSATPAYFKITRAGDTFTAYTSGDGVSWAVVPNSRFTFAPGVMPAAALAGLCVDASSASATSTATFDTVVVGTPLSWNPSVTTMAAARTGAATALGLNGAVYVFGGSDGTTDTNSLSIYNPTTNAWTQGAALPTTRTDAQAVTLPDGRIAVLGGEAGCGPALPCASGGRVFATVEIYTPSSDSWTTAAPMPVARERFAAVLYHGQVYVIGGGDGTAIVHRVDVYDPGTNSWSPAGTAPDLTATPDLMAPAAVVDARGAIDVIGGFDGVDPPGNFLYVYNGTGWSSGPPLPHYVQGGAATLGPDGRVDLLGGYDGGQFLPTTQIYDPGANSWTYGPPLPTALYRRGVVTLPNGQLLVLGGNGVGGTSGAMAFYGPTIAATPDGGSPGSTTTLIGQGFTPGGAVAVAWGGAGGAPITADATGALTLTLTVPTTVTRGENTITAQDLTATYPVTTSYAGSGLVWNTGLTALPQGRENPAGALGQNGHIYVFGVGLLT